MITDPSYEVLSEEGTIDLRLIETFIRQLLWKPVAFFFRFPVETLQNGSDADSFDSQVKSYRKWLEERRKTRGILNNCGLKKEWLKNKSDRTELESRVLKQMILKGRPEIIVKKVVIMFKKLLIIINL